jgi:hypothetical protein
VTTTETLYITFGVQYASKPHPTLEHVDPDSWMEVRGLPERMARDVAFAITGGRHAFDYTDATFRRELHPAGRPFLVIDAASWRLVQAALAWYDAGEDRHPFAENALGDAVRAYRRSTTLRSHYHERREPT